MNSKTGIEIYAYDLFDTIVHRNCHPDVVLFEWSKKVSRYLRFLFSPKEIYDLRKKTENEIKKNGKEEATYEQLMMQLCDCLKIEQGLEKEFIENATKWEIEVELRHLSVDSVCLKEIVALKEKGYTVIIISDFYASRFILQSILERLSVYPYIDKLYVSSEYGKRKSTGNLYKYVLHDLELTPEKLYMTGDDRISDVEIPERLGIKTKYRPYRQLYKKDSEADFNNKYKKVLFHSTIKTGVEVYAGEILFFVDKLYEQLIQEGFSTVAFCSREGQLIKKFFDIYQKKTYGDEYIKTKYLYVSRKAILAPSLKNLSEEKFESLFRQYKEILVCDFLNSLGMKDEKYVNILKKSGVEMNDVITSSVDDPILKKIRSCEKFVTLYDEYRSYQKKLFVQYLTGLELVNNNKIAVVDIGWKGTIQDCIQKILGNQIVVKGYYLGLISQEFECVNLENKKGVLFSDYPDKCLNYELLQYGHIFYERIFAADHGPVQGYTLDESGEVLPEIDNDKDQLTLFKYMKDYQKYLEKSFAELVDLYSKSYYLPKDRYNLMIKSTLWRQCVISPKLWNVVIQSRASAHENFGNISVNGKENLTRIKVHKNEKKKFFYVDYAYRILDRYHLKLLNPIAALYCRMIYLIKLSKIEKG